MVQITITCRRGAKLIYPGAVDKVQEVQVEYL